MPISLESTPIPNFSKNHAFELAGLLCVHFNKLHVVNAVTFLLQRIKESTKSSVMTYLSQFIELNSLH